MFHLKHVTDVFSAHKYAYIKKNITWGKIAGCGESDAITEGQLKFVNIYQQKLHS